MPGILMYCTNGDTDIPEACDIRIQFLYTEIDTFPAQGIHHGCVFNYTWRDESDKVIEKGIVCAFFSSLREIEDTRLNGREPEELQMLHGSCKRASNIAETDRYAGDCNGVSSSDFPAITWSAI